MRMCLENRSRRKRLKSAEFLLISSGFGLVDFFEHSNDLANFILKSKLSTGFFFVPVYTPHKGRRTFHSCFFLEFNNSSVRKVKRL